MSEPKVPETAPAPVTLPEAVEQALVNGNLQHLSPAERTVLYRHTCESLGLNPLTTPFAYLELNRRLVLYATRNCTDQLRKLHGVDLTITARERVGDVYVVTARARLPNGRTDEEIGAVAIEGLRGEALANALMKATTKAKRRVTLSIVGLSLLDELEVATIPDAQLYSEAMPAALPSPESDQPDQPDPAPALPPAPRIGSVEDFWRACHALVGGRASGVAGAVRDRLGSEAAVYKQQHGLTWSNVYALLEANVRDGEPIPGAPPSLGGTPEDYGCAMCGEPLKATTFRDGTEWTAAKLAQLSSERHGMVLCMTHYREANDAKRVGGDRAEAAERGATVPF
jgi:hypothetical protein